MKKNEICEFLPWDSEFFGIRIAKVKSTLLNLDQFLEVLDWCSNNQIECLYCLFDSQNLDTIRLAERFNLNLHDIRVTLENKNLDKFTEHASNTERKSSITIRQSLVEDIPVLINIGRSSFRQTRFYSDKNFSRDSCDALYETWIKQSCQGYANIVLVAVIDNLPAGFISCHLDGEPLNGRIGLLAVDSQFQGTGIGNLLINRALNWFANHRVDQVSVVTQGSNITAQRLYQRCGFRTSSVQLWYHKWFDLNKLKRVHYE
jgi:dTDP-4-amino-4,6-dideoxy-D-galactose acyltransferase